MLCNFRVRPNENNRKHHRGSAHFNKVFPPPLPSLCPPNELPCEYGGKQFSDHMSNDKENDAPAVLHNHQEDMHSLGQNIFTRTCFPRLKISTRLQLFI